VGVRQSRPVFVVVGVTVVALVGAVGGFCCQSGFLAACCLVGRSGFCCRGGLLAAILRLLLCCGRFRLVCTSWCWGGFLWLVWPRGWCAVFWLSVWTSQPSTPFAVFGKLPMSGTEHLSRILGLARDNGFCAVRLKDCGKFVLSVRQSFFVSLPVDARCCR